ncbi:response regulator transcription factor [Ruminiclostridium cellulolyticum]|uniref:Stage 0 sporulation protein A homolog n=1 Tax=Ruminiclostridium cellulolyticum (strain ATCC 35319 / DSM 5812 / JCM 6584 / H10) TaxID=394503 RepID=B8I6Y9_RUMCH|nr:response regulator transcription factor [Ruminiclostridium cellulolyticum]ACL76981.1 two component transcriptional regulator, winged helix family [Ruminiclostridium cellulolyticum H10]
MEKYNILVIDDDKEIVELIRIYLQNEGYNVLVGFNGDEGVEILAKQKIHLLILDIMLPGEDGLQICRKIRESYIIPIIMVSAKSCDMDKIMGLGTGADDYLAKPFNPMELMARVKSQLRRSFYMNTQVLDKQHDENIINICGLSINKNNHTVSLLGNIVDLTPTEYEILLLLAGSPGKVFSVEKIFESVWKQKFYESNNTVMVHIWRMREKLESNPKEPKIIKTIWGVGYKIEG